MYVLALESSGPIGGVALVGQEESHEIIESLGPGRGEILSELVREVLKRSQVGWEEISLIAVDIGPGSFTGLRVGLSLAKALAQVHGLPLVPVRQTEAVGLPLVEFWPGRVCVWIHDRREYLYVGWVEQGGAGGETILSLPEALARVRERADVLLVGTGALRFAAEIQAQLPKVSIAPAFFAYPRPSVVARIGQTRYTCEGPANLYTLEPHYVHKEGGHG